MSLVGFSQSDNDISTPDDITVEVDDVTKKLPDDIMIYEPSLTEDSRVTIVAKVEGAPRPDITWKLYNKVRVQINVVSSDISHQITPQLHD